MVPANNDTSTLMAKITIRGMVPLSLDVIAKRCSDIFAFPHSESYCLVLSRDANATIQRIERRCYSLTQTESYRPQRQLAGREEVLWERYPSLALVGLFWNFITSYTLALLVHLDWNEFRYQEVLAVAEQQIEISRLVRLQQCGNSGNVVSSCAPTSKNSSSSSAIVAIRVVVGQATGVGTAGDDGETSKEPDDHSSNGGV
ncbi:hypothetical protein Tco_0912515 [Tanacetum coccineum]